MGRGRTTTGMCVASLIATIEQNSLQDLLADDEDEEEEGDQGLDQTQYLNGQSGRSLYCGPMPKYRR